MPNTPNSSRPPDIWTSAQRYFGPKVRAVAAGLGPNAFSGSLPFLAPYLQPQPSALPKNWNTAQAVHCATQSSPVLQGHLTQPQFAHAAQHDLGSLHGIETTLKAMAPKAEDVFWRGLHGMMPGGLLIDGPENGFGNKPGDVEKSFGAGATDSVGSALRGLGAFGDSTTRSVTRLVAGEKGVTDYQRHRAHGDFAPLPSDLFTAAANPLFDGATSLKKGVRDTPLTRVSETAGNIAPGLAVSAVNPYVGAAFFAAQGADSQNQAAIRAGKAGSWQADLGVLGNAGAQGVLGLIPGVGVERYLPKVASPVANAILRAGSHTAQGAASGVSSNVIGNVIEKYTVNPDKDIWDGTPESAIWGGVLGAAHGVKAALPGPRHAPAAEHPVPEAPHPENPEPAPAPAQRPDPHPAARAAAAIVNHHTLSEAVRTARASTLRRDDPARFQAFTAKVADAAEASPIQVAPDVLDSVLATPEGQRVQAAVPDLPERVVAAREAGAEVSMPAHEYLTHVGPELHDRIAGDVRVGPDAMTPAEAVADQEARVAGQKNASAEAEAGAPDPEAFRQSRQALTDVIRQHYDRETVGRLSPDQRAEAAELAGHALAVEAANRGVEPLEMYRREAMPEQGDGDGGLDESAHLENDAPTRGTSGMAASQESEKLPSVFDPDTSTQKSDIHVRETGEAQEIQQNFNSVPESYIKPGVEIDMRLAPPSSDKNAAGHPRNGAWFWRQLLKAHPEYFDKENEKRIKISQSPSVNQTWIDSFPTHQGFVDDKLVHHHIDQGPLATPLPERVHQTWHKVLHPKETGKTHGR